MKTETEVILASRFKFPFVIEHSNNWKTVLHTDKMKMMIGIYHILRKAPPLHNYITNIQAMFNHSVLHISPWTVCEDGWHYGFLKVKPKGGFIAP